MKRVFFSFLLGVASFYSLSAQSQSDGKIIDGIVWVVGDQEILKSDVENALKQALEENVPFKKDPRCEIAEQLAVNKLFLHQADIDSVTVSNEDVKKQVDYAIQSRIDQVGSVKGLEDLIGKKLPELRAMLQKNFKDMQIISREKLKIVGNLRLSPSQIADFYKKIPQKDLPYIPKTVEVQIITMSPKIPLIQIDEVKEQLRKLRTRVKNGESFSSLAIMYSEDMATASNGGELGLKSKSILESTLDPNFSAAAFALKNPGQISNVVESQDGFHIIQLIDRVGERGNFRHIMIRPKVSNEDLEKTKVKMDSLYQNIERGKVDFGKAAYLYSSDKETKNNNGIMANNNPNSKFLGTPRFSMEDLNSSIATQVDSMKVGEISKPFEMTMKKGNKVIAIIKLSKKIDGHKADLNTDYQSIKEMAIASQTEKILQDWINQKISSSYIYINKSYRTCDFKYKNWIKK